MFFFIWNDILYRPLFNLLIWIYNNWTEHSLGWAVIYVTIFLRFILLPLDIITEYKKRENDELWNDVKRLDRELHNDEVLKKEEIRKIIKHKKVRPWAKAFSLGIQFLVLVLLYQVFLHGITGENLMNTLYPSVEWPGKINTNFYGFDVGAVHDILWSGIVGLWLFIEIYVDYRKKRKMGVGFQKADLAYFFIFPGSVFFLLWMLPMVKSLFILTSMIISIIVHQVLKPFISTDKT